MPSTAESAAKNDDEPSFPTHVTILHSLEVWLDEWVDAHLNVKLTEFLQEREKFDQWDGATDEDIRKIQEANQEIEASYESSLKLFRDKLDALQAPENFWPLVHIQQLVAQAFSTDDWEKAVVHFNEAQEDLRVWQLLSHRPFLTTIFEVSETMMSQHLARATFDVRNLQEWLEDFVPGGKKTVQRKRSVLGYCQYLMSRHEAFLIRKARGYSGKGRWSESKMALTGLYIEEETDFVEKYDSDGNLLSDF